VTATVTVTVVACVTVRAMVVLTIDAVVPRWT
jgi:hypothetical protein